MAPYAILGLVLLLSFNFSFGQISSLYGANITGKLTFYGAGADSGGSCLYNNPTATLATLMPTVAIGDFQNSATCGMCLMIYPLGTGSGNSDFPTRPPFIAFVNNQCPSCDSSSLDLAQTSDGAWDIKWHAVDCPVNDDIKLQLKQGTSVYNSYVQARNFVTAISSIEFNVNNNWVMSNRQSYNYFLYASLVTLPVQLRLTSVFGDQLLLTLNDYNTIEPNLISTGLQFTSSTGTPTTIIPTPTANPTSTPTYTTPVTPPTTSTTPTTPTGSSTSGILTTSKVGSSYNRFTEFIQALTTLVVDGQTRVVLSSGGAAGGVVSEGQGYGLLIGGVTAVAIGYSDANFDTVVNQTYQIYSGWKRMCTLSVGSSSCQNPYYCGGGAYPCLPNWKFDNNLSNSLGTGPAPDGDEDAILGMILLLKATEPVKSEYSWWSDLAEWTYQSCKQFYNSNTVTSGGYVLLKLGACWGGFDCNNPSYHSPGSYRAFRNYMVQYQEVLGHSGEGTTYVPLWDTLVNTSYTMLLADQCPSTGLTTNWYIPNSDLSVPGSVSSSCDSSGTPPGQFGSEASRGVWRVGLDFLWFSGESPLSMLYLDRIGNELLGKYSAGQFGNLDIDSTCLVQSVFSGWQSEAFIYGPLFTTLMKPMSGVDNQQAILDVAGEQVAGSAITDYYAGCWTTISTFTLNGDILKAAELVGGSSICTNCQQDSTQSQSNNKPHSTAGVVVPVVIVVLLCVAVIIFGYFYYKKKEEQV